MRNCYSNFLKLHITILQVYFSDAGPVKKWRGLLHHQKITLVYICRIRMRIYVIKSLKDIYMSNNF